MGNCSTRAANSAENAQEKTAAAMASPPTSNRSEHAFSQLHIDFKALISNLESHMWRHATITWVMVPAFGALQAFVPFLRPTCETGFRDITLIFVVIYEAHHIFSESKAWHSTIELLTPPEKTIMRHLGVLRARKAYFWLGFIESLDLYTDVTFPFVAMACEAHLTARWKATWELVPGAGPLMVIILDKVRFWGFCLILVGINVFVTGWLGLIQMQRNRDATNEVIAKTDERIPGEVFFNFAQSSETAMMPSVAMLSEEIANERKYKFDATKDTTEAMSARMNVGFGKTTERQAFEMELASVAEEERIAKAANCHFLMLMLVKVCIGYCMQLWLQSSFYAVTFNHTGVEAKAKIIISMVCSSIQALVRCKIILPKLGGLGFAFLLFATFIIAWSGAKVYYAYHCESHLWNLSTLKCVTYESVPTLIETTSTLAPFIAGPVPPSQ